VRFRKFFLTSPRSRCYP